MLENKIELKTVQELLGMNFFIPSYQRGYRWTPQQVTDLLNDIWDFAQKDNSAYYCLQPLVIKKKTDEEIRKTEAEVLKKIKEETSSIDDVKILLKEGLKEKWEVIDGQQRLTTIFLILSVLRCENLYSLNYETRPGSALYLKNVPDEYKEEEGNIDYFHIFQAKRTIKDFLEKEKNGADFKETLLHKVKFIWYESVEENPIEVFTRLNIGKIPLTNAELIKALILNSSNFEVSDNNYLRLRQQEIASEWDNIEYTLQNDEFWLFLHELKYDKPTRIDFIFDLICEQNSLKNEKIKEIGTDEHRTFRYFFEYFKSEKKNIELCWKEVKKYFQIFQEWFNDLELYHYIGYLIDQSECLNKLCESWNDCKSKDDFKIELKKKIQGTIRKCLDLNHQYEINGAPPKTDCRALLLLHNIQTVINQNKKIKSKKEYALSVFYKFPFHLYKKENWDVEHVDSNVMNALDKEKDQKEWLKYSILDEKVDDLLKDKVKKFLRGDPDRDSFDELYEKILEINQAIWKNPEQEKNKIGNFVLLDSNTNRGYGNAIFPAKRRCIIGKDQGIKYSISDNLEVKEDEGGIAFVPPVTKNVFLKYYNTSAENLREWNEEDANAYKKNICEILKDFGVYDSSYCSEGGDCGL